MMVQLLTWTVMLALVIVLLPSLTILSGSDSSAGAPVPHATIAVTGTDLGTAADADGKFSLALPPGEYRLRISAIGFRDVHHDVTLPAGSPVDLDIEVAEQIFEPGHVVVTGTLRETYVAD